MSPRPRPARLRWLALAAAFAAPLAAGCTGAGSSAGDIDGQALYEELCARCHGPDGEPTPSMVAQHGVRDLTEPTVQAEMTDDEIHEQVIRGSRNHQMPAFGGVVSDEEIEAVIRHVRTFE